MEILTNEIEIKYENVETFYNIFCITINYSNDKEIYKDILKLIDSIDKEKTCAIYRPGKRFTLYLLVDKNFNFTDENIFYDYEFLDYFEKKYGKLNIVKFELSKEVYNENRNSIILNLLLIFIKNKSTSLESYDGKLYEYLETKRNGQVITYNYYFNNMFLCIDVVTFSPKKSETSDSTYYIDGSFLRKGKDEKHLFIKQNKTKKKNLMKFFNPSNKNDFMTSKLVKVWWLIDLFNNCFGEFIKLDFKKKNVCEIKYESISSRSTNKKSYFIKIEEIVKERRINIINNLEQECVIKSFINYFKEKQMPYLESNKVMDDAFNINLIHEKKDNKEDKYIYSKTAPLQNITYENFFQTKKKENSEEKVFNDSKMRVIFSELVLKEDVINRKISIYKTKNKIIDNFIFGETKKILGKYYSFEIEINRDKMMFSNQKHIYDKRMKLKECKYMINKRTKEKVFINELEEYPIANIRCISDDIDKFYKGIDVSDFISNLEKLDKTLFEGFNYQNIISSLKIKDEVSLFSFSKDIGKSLKNKIKKHLYNISNGKYFLNLSWRKTEGAFVKIYTDLKYWIEDGKIKYYSTGCKNLNQCLTNKFVVREIALCLSEDEILDYFKLLDIDNIRNSQASVVPFPYKYLKEYENMMINEWGLKSKDDDVQI